MVQTLMAQKIKTVGVIGAGQMGSGIAQVMAHLGEYDVLLQDVMAPQLEKARNGITQSLSKFVSKEILTEAAKENTLQRITFITELEQLAGADIVIEAVIEDESLKKNIFQQLDNVLSPTAIIASNTSSISITRLAAATARPQNVIGMHFMNPVPLMKLVEIIRGAQTSDETYQVVAELGQKVGKTTVISYDYPGFISNRVLLPMINEAIFALFEGVGSAEDIDTVMKLGMNHPMGPLQLADFIGLDTCLAILNVLYDGFKDPKYRPCPLLVQKVNAGYLGKKVGKGFFEYH
jgi:3-hydroxybutyryl-CoA dehydrogenase